jgi:hypothetical protein
MPSRSLLRSFLALWMLTGLLLVIASAATVREAWAGARHANPHLVLLGGVEALAALLFLVPRTFRVGAVGLLVAFGVASVVHAAVGQVRGDLLLYAVVVLFALVHGPLTDVQWRAAFSGRAV